MAASAPVDAGPRETAMSNLLARVLTAAVLGAMSLAAIHVGGAVYAIFLAALLIGLVVEWAALLRAAGARALPRHAGWLVWFGPAIAAAFWLREVHGAEALVWCLAVVWASDIAAYFVGRALRGRASAPARPGAASQAGLPPPSPPGRSAPASSTERPARSGSAWPRSPSRPPASRAISRNRR